MTEQKHPQSVSLSGLEPLPEALAAAVRARQIVTAVQLHDFVQTELDRRAIVGADSRVELSVDELTQWRDRIEAMVGPSVCRRLREARLASDAERHPPGVLSPADDPSKKGGGSCRG